MIKQVKFVSIPVEDQDRALDFYTEKLGFTIITDQPFDEKQRWIELRVPKAETRVVLFTTDEDKGRVGTFMSVRDVCHAGHRPNNIAVMVATANVNPSTRTSNETS